MERFLRRASEHWIPLVPEWEPLRKKSNFNVRIACILDTRLYQGFKHEADLMPVTPENWQNILEFGKPDFLIVESLWKSVSQHWRMALLKASPERNLLLTIIQAAKKLCIPTIYWFTMGCEYHGLFSGIAEHFDFVFCADPLEAERLRNKNIAVEILLPCVQPAIFNPYRKFDQYNDLNIPVLFDGWADMGLFVEELKMLKEIQNKGLSIIESRRQCGQKKQTEPLPYLDCFRGLATRQARISALKYANMAVSFGKSYSSPVSQQWMALEIIASKVPLVHFGPLLKDDMRNGVVMSYEDQLEFLLEIHRLSEDMMYRHQCGVAAWRTALAYHTFSHRLKTLCEYIGYQNTWEEFPSLSILVCTRDSQQVELLIENFSGLTYQNKELVIIYNGENVPSLHNEKQAVKIQNVPKELSLGTCLRIGLLEVKGDYIFLMDDKVRLGENFLFDFILQLRCVEHDLFKIPVQKSPSDQVDDLYLKNTLRNCLFSGSDDKCFDGKSNLLAIKTASQLYNRICKDSDDPYMLIDRCRDELVITDMFNAVLER